MDTTRRSMLGAIVASAAIPAAACGASPTEFKVALSRYFSTKKDCTAFHRDIYRPAYCGWKAAGSPKGTDFDHVFAATTEKEEAVCDTLDQAVNARAETISELRAKVDLLDEVGAFDDANEWFRSLAADVRRLAAH